MATVSMFVTPIWRPCPSRENALILCLTSLLRAFIKTMQNEKMNNFTLLPEVENMLSLQTTFIDF